MGTLKLSSGFLQEKLMLGRMGSEEGRVRVSLQARPLAAGVIPATESSQNYPGKYHLSGSY